MPGKSRLFWALKWQRAKPVVPFGPKKVKIILRKCIGMGVGGEKRYEVYLLRTAKMVGPHRGEYILIFSGTGYRDPHREEYVLQHMYIVRPARSCSSVPKLETGTPKCRTCQPEE